MTVLGAILAVAGVVVAGCSSGTSGASGAANPRRLSTEQASAYAAGTGVLFAKGEADTLALLH